MGSSISAIIKEATSNDDEERATKETLESLYELGKSRVDTAYQRATATDSKIYAPISTVLFRKQKIISSTKNDPGAITDGIFKGVGELIQGNFLTGVSTIVKEALTVVLGESSGQVSSENTYSLIATDLAALMRIDIDVYNFEITSKTLMKKTSRMTAISMLVSSVKTDSLTVNDLRAIVSLSYGGLDKTVQADILKSVIEAYYNTKQPMSADDFAAYQQHFWASTVAGTAARPSPGLLVGSGADVDLDLDLRHPPRRIVWSGDGAGAAAGDPTTFQLVVPLAMPVTPAWATRMTSHISGIVDASGLKGKLTLTPPQSPELGGNVVSFGFTVVGGNDYESVIKQFDDVIIANVANAGALSFACSSFRLQCGVPASVKPRGVAVEGTVVNQTDLDIHCYDEAYLEVATVRARAAETAVSARVLFLETTSGTIYEPAPGPAPPPAKAKVTFTRPSDSTPALNMEWEEGQTKRLLRWQQQPLLAA